jgi:hypothetical protein
MFSTKRPPLAQGRESDPRRWRCSGGDASSSRESDEAAASAFAVSCRCRVTRLAPRARSATSRRAVLFNQRRDFCRSLGAKRRPPEHRRAWDVRTHCAALPVLSEQAGDRCSL